MASTTLKAEAPSLNARATRTLEFIVKIVAIGVPVLYALGRIYLESYWQTLRLPSSLMGYAAEDYLYSGFMSLAVGMSRLIGVELYSTMAYAAIFAAVTAALAMVMYSIDRFVGPHVRARIAASQRLRGEAKKSKQSDAIRYVQIGAAVWSVTTTIILVFTAAGVLLLLPIVLAVKAGQGQAEAERASYLQPQSAKRGVRPILAHYESDGIEVTAPLVECSESWCVVFRLGDFVAIPRAQVLRVDQKIARGAGGIDTK